MFDPTHVPQNADSAAAGRARGAANGKLPQSAWPVENVLTPILVRVDQFNLNRVPCAPPATGRAVWLVDKAIETQLKTEAPGSFDVSPTLF